MVYLETDETGRVQLRHNRPSDLTDKQKSDGVVVDSVPERPDGDSLLFVENGSPAWKQARYQHRGDLAELKSFLKEKVLERQEEEETKPVTMNGHEFPADRDSQGRISSAIQQVKQTQVPFPTMTTDKTQVELTLSELRGLSDKYADQVRSARANAQSLLSTIESASSADTLLSLDIESGW